MPYPAQFSHIVLSGQLPGGERWATGFWQTESESPGGWSQSEWDDRVAQYRDAVETPDGGTDLMTALRRILSASSSWDRVTAYLYEGTLAAASFVGEIGPTAGPMAGTGGAVHPHQVSACVSWRAGAGASRRGRSYFVANGATMLAAGRFDPSVCDDLGEGFASFYGSLGIPSVVPIVVSRKLGAASNVNVILVDDVPDVIRRRVDHLAAGHTSSTPMPV